MLLSGPRVYARMAQDGVLPAPLGRLHGDHPRIAVLAQAAMSLVVVWSAGLRTLLEFAGVTLSLSAGAVVLGWLIRRLREGSALRKAPQLAAALLFLTATTGLLIATVAMRPASLIAAAALIGAGLLAYAIGGRRQAMMSGVS